jgi:O-antigen/teichoic acid export membrane protein
MNEKEKSYRNTVLIALSTVVNIFFSILKNKVLAVWLGPASLGKFSILSDLTNFASSMTTLGVNNSGVQALSRASSENDEAKVIHIYNGLMRFFSTLAVIVCIGIIISASFLSELMVHNNSLTLFIRIAAITVVIKVVGNIQNALIAAMQRIGLLAKANIYSGAIITVISILLAVLLRENSIPYLVITVAFVFWVISYIQVKKVLTQLPAIKTRIAFTQIKPILILGVATIWASFLESIVSLVSKSSITKTFGENYLGYYQVAIGFTFQYISFITTAITTDYYPRLTATVIKGNKEVADFVNQQIGISMSLIMPLLLIMLTFSKFFLKLLFSEAFLPSDDLISYSIPGTLLLVVCWPIAYVFLAHRATKTYIFTEFTGNSSHLILILIAVSISNFSYLGIAYILHYIIYMLLIIYLFYKKYEGYISMRNVYSFLINCCIIALVIVFKKTLTVNLAYTAGIFLVLLYLFIVRKDYIEMFKVILKRR